MPDQASCSEHVPTSAGFEQSLIVVGHRNWTARNSEVAPNVVRAVIACANQSSPVGHSIVALGVQRGPPGLSARNTIDVMRKAPPTRTTRIVAASVAIAVAVHVYEFSCPGVAPTTIDAPLAEDGTVTRTGTLTLPPASASRL